MSQFLIHDYLSQLDLIKKVIDLLQRVTTVSVQTVQITKAMKGVAR